MLKSAKQATDAAHNNSVVGQTDEMQIESTPAGVATDEQKEEFESFAKSAKGKVLELDDDDG
jgi:hypothetical protein